MGPTVKSLFLPVHAVAKYPENLSPVEGASIWMQYLTAYGLIELGKMQQGNNVLITAAASSVGLAAIQLANAVDAIPIATTRNKAKEASLKDAGANDAFGRNDLCVWCAFARIDTVSDFRQLSPS